MPRWPSYADIGQWWAVPAKNQKWQIALRLLYKIPVIICQIPLVLSSALLGLGLYGNPKWSVLYTLEIFLLKRVLSSLSSGTISIVDVVSTDKRAAIPTAKNGHRKLVNVPARSDKYIGDASHAQVRPASCPAFWTWTDAISEPSATSHKGRVLLYLVGGAYVAGHPLETGFDIKLSKSTGLPVFSVNYRKAVHPHLCFPAALQDAIAGFFYLLDEGYSAEDVIICGDSAGGGLSITTCLYLQKEKMPVPGSVFLVSPWVDLDVQNRSYNKQRVHRDFLDMRRLAHSAIQYAWHRPDFQNTLLSPVQDKLPDGYTFKGFPRTLITFGSDEAFFEEDMAFVRLLQHYGVDVEAVVQEDDIHVYCALPFNGLELRIFDRLKSFTRV